MEVGKDHTQQPHLKVHCKFCHTTELLLQPFQLLQCVHVGEGCVLEPPYRLQAHDQATPHKTHARTHAHTHTHTRTHAHTHTHTHPFSPCAVLPPLPLALSTEAAPEEARNALTRTGRDGPVQPCSTEKGWRPVTQHVVINSVGNVHLASICAHSLAFAIMAFSDVGFCSRRKTVQCEQDHKGVTWHSWYNYTNRPGEASGRWACDG